MKNSTIKSRGLSIGSILLFILAWKLLALFFNQEIIVPSPERTLEQLLVIVKSGDFWPAVAATVYRGILGFIISCAAGLLLGFAAGFSHLVFWFLQPWVVIIRTTPVMSIIILAIIWFKADQVPVFVTFLMIFPIVYGNVVVGIRNVDQQLLQMARVYRVKLKRVIFELYLPSILPYFAAGASTAMGMAWKVIIAAEILSQPVWAIGTNLMDAKIYLATAEVFAWTIVAIIISFVFEYLLTALENRLKTWG